MDDLILDEVIIVQHQNDIVFLPGDFIDQNCRYNFIGQWLGITKHIQGRFAHAWLNGLAGFYKICPKPDGVIIGIVQGYPSHWAPILLNKFD